MFVETKELIVVEPFVEPKHPSPYHELAEYIRQGCRMTKPAQGTFFYGLDGACAMGAAWLARTGERKTYDGVVRDMCETFGIGEFTFAWITLKNDSGMSREAIADWLDTFTA